MNDLRALAQMHGVAIDWYDISGTLHVVPDSTLEAVLNGLGVDPAHPNRKPEPPLLVVPDGQVVVPELPADCAYVVALDDGGACEGRSRPVDGGGSLEHGLPMGLHELRWDGGRRHILSAPERCLLPSELGCPRGFGVSAQLYGLKSSRPSLIGDFGDLATAAGLAGDAGADFFGLSPLHTLFMADAHARSPYSPSHRAFVNPLYIDVVSAAERLGVAPPTAASYGPELIDYPAVAAAKRDTFDALFAAYRGAGDSSGLDAFRRASGEGLERHCRFEALHEAALAIDRDRWPFWLWPEGWRHPEHPEVEAFAQANAERVAFFAFLQWLAEQQLADAQATAQASGMRLGLYRDLAVGVNPAGSMAWSSPGLTVRGLTIGAPPDPLGPDGQNWGLAPFAPTRLADLGYRPLLDDLAANARHAGAVRIDHVLGFARQFWIPEGAPASAGTYVGFPFEVLARLCALVSHRYRCVIIGEDLGTVPDGFRDRLRERGMLSCRVLWFERDGERLRTPGEYPEQAMASVSTHDLPTVRGFLASRDLEWRAELGGQDGDARQAAQAAREKEIREIGEAIDGQGFSGDPMPVALHRYLGASASALAMVQLEDLAGILEQPNLPGTLDEHPNWQRRLPVPAEEVMASPFADEILQVMRETRSRG